MAVLSSSETVDQDVALKRDKRERGSSGPFKSLQGNDKERHQGMLL